MTAQQTQGQQNQLSQLELAAARLKALESLITDEILYQRAKKENLIPSDQDVNTFIQQSKAEGGMTEEAFQKQLKESNQTEADFKETIRKQMSIRKLQENISNQIKVSDREVEEFFKVNKSFCSLAIVMLLSLIRSFKSCISAVASRSCLFDFTS